MQARRPATGRRAELGPRHGGSRPRGPARTGAHKRAPAGDRVPWHELTGGIAGYLPLAVLTTLSVTVLPAILAESVVRPRGLAGALAAAATAVALSLLIALAEALVWRRLHGARGVVYSDLMLWGFVRRLWAERRLKRVGAAYRSAVGSDGTVRVELLEGISHLLEIRNPYTYGHCRRVARHAERIAAAMHLGPAEIAEVRTAALVHDIGKVYTPAAVLQKQGPLDDDEFETIKRHAADGADMLAPVRDRQLASIVRHHHERMDGSGYPDGLCGEEIPLGARIVAVADTFDAITSHRPYRRARSQREAMAVLDAEAGRLLDADVVEAFERSASPRRSMASASLAGAVSARIAATLQLLPGGLLGGASLAGVLPAIGAAGLLAVAPDARYEKAAARGATAPAGALQVAFPGALGSVETVSGGAGAPVAGRHGAGVVPLRRRTAGGTPLVPATGERTSGGGGLPTPGSAGAEGHAPAGVPGLPLPGLPGGSGEAPVAEVPAPPDVPPVKVPPVKVPPVSVPPVNVPPVSTPPVTTPQPSVGPVTVPGVTVPSVTVHPPAVPGVSLPGSGRAPGS
jgi:putative nucleotidyltransferase with HDIG domain